MHIRPKIQSILVGFLLVVIISLLFLNWYMLKNKTLPALSAVFRPGNNPVNTKLVSSDKIDGFLKHSKDLNREIHYVPAKGDIPEFNWFLPMLVGYKLDDTGLILYYTFRDGFGAIPIDMVSVGPVKMENGKPVDATSYPISLGPLAQTTKDSLQKILNDLLNSSDNKSHLLDIRVIFPVSPEQCNSWPTLKAFVIDKRCQQRKLSNAKTFDSVIVKALTTGSDNIDISKVDHNSQELIKTVRDSDLVELAVPENK